MDSKINRLEAINNFCKDLSLVWKKHSKMTFGEIVRLIAQIYTPTELVTVSDTEMTDTIRDTLDGEI